MEQNWNSGLNGSGKSSLKIIAGVDKNYQDVVSSTWIHGWLFVEQEPQLDDSKTTLKL
jgi:ATPase subunit of ABC transporter with duplicated ATPase domains